MPDSPLQNPVQSAVPATVNPLALSVEETARMLSAGGGRRVTPEQVQADIDAGAPLGRDGRINLVHYAAWLVREVQAR
jgi:hypothetical protein